VLGRLHKDQCFYEFTSENNFFASDKENEKDGGSSSVPLLQLHPYNALIEDLKNKRTDEF
jgi:hypothetical protein